MMKHFDLLRSQSNKLLPWQQRLIPSWFMIVAAVIYSPIQFSDTFISPHRWLVYWRFIDWLRSWNKIWILAVQRKLSPNSAFDFAALQTRSCQLTHDRQKSSKLQKKWDLYGSRLLIIRAERLFLTFTLQFWCYDQIRSYITIWQHLVSFVIKWACGRVVKASDS